MNIFSADWGWGLLRGKKQNGSPLIKHEMTPVEQRPCFLFPKPCSKVSSREGQCLIFPITSSSFARQNWKLNGNYLFPFFKHSRVLQGIKQKNVLLSKTNFLINHITKAHPTTSLEAETKWRQRPPCQLTPSHKLIQPPPALFSGSPSPSSLSHKRLEKGSVKNPRFPGEGGFCR